MRDIPVFTTQYGAASLILNQIPYSKRAYIRILDSREAEKLLAECVEFSKAAGAEKICCARHPVCEGFPEYTTILRMQGHKEQMGETEACIFPVTEATVGQWRQIYNEKGKDIPGGRLLSAMDERKLLQDGDCYFVHSDGKLLGTGKASGDQIQWLCAVMHGAGRTVMQALCQCISEDTFYLEVSDRNEKALRLYRGMGMLPVGAAETWYEINI